MLTVVGAWLVESIVIRHLYFKKGIMPKRLLIIGNGFDIDLGLRTRYSDFANSES